MTNYDTDLAYRQNLAYASDRERDLLNRQRWHSRLVDPSTGNITLPDFSDHCTESYCDLMRELSLNLSRPGNLAQP